MKTAIRIEHSQTGTGHFRDSEFKKGTEAIRWDVTYVLPELANRHEKFKTMYRELNDSYGYKYDEMQKFFCAYKTIEQFNQWVMPDEAKILIEYGFIIYLIDLKEFIEGDDQIFYEKKNILQMKNINSLFM